MFNSTIKRNYILGKKVSIDEMLVSYRGRCIFLQYMPRKPSKYRIKMWCICDSKSSYVYTLIIYVRRSPNQVDRAVNLGKIVVMQLTAPLYNSGRTIYTDNFFTSIPLIEELLEKKLTYVGTICKNKKQLPIFTKNKNRQEGSVIQTFNDKLVVTLLSFIPKKK